MDEQSYENAITIDGALDREVDWKDIDPFKFIFYSFTFFTGVRGLVYPSTLVKTRIQTQPAGTYRSTFHAFRTIAAHEGIRGFYKGFPTMALGVLPSQTLYITTLEMVRTYIPVDSKGMSASFAGGACASCASATIGVPVDVISQRLMIQDGKSVQKKL